MDRKEVKKILKSSCRGVLNDLLEDVGFTRDEKRLFVERYINDHSPFSSYVLYSYPLRSYKISQITQ